MQTPTPRRGAMTGTANKLLVEVPATGRFLIARNCLGFFNHDTVAHIYSVIVDVNGTPTTIWKSPSVPAGEGCTMEKQIVLTAAAVESLYGKVDANLTTTESTFDVAVLEMTP